jgi:hypothetical protein
LLKARPEPALVAVGAEGVAGTVVAVIEEDELDAGPVPETLVAVTAKV